MTFQIVIAGICVEVTSMYDQVYRLCAPYLANQEQPEISVQIDSEDLHKEALLNGENWPITEGRAAYLETMAVYRKIADRLLDRRVVLMHGTLLNCSGSGLLITAPSGVGKTTRARLWVDNAPDTYIVNGDKPLIAIGEEVIAYGTPWNGKEGIGRNESVPLRAICILKRSHANQLVRVEAREVLKCLMNQIYLPKDGKLQLKTLALLNDLCGKVPIYRMDCDREVETVRAFYDILGREGIIEQK